MDQKYKVCLWEVRGVHKRTFLKEVKEFIKLEDATKFIRSSSTIPLFKLKTKPDNPLAKVCPEPEGINIEYMERIDFWTQKVSYVGPKLPFIKATIFKQKV